LAQKQKKSLEVKILRPWDMKVDPQNRAPLKPFDKIEDLKNGVQRIFDRLDPEIAAEFAEMNWRGNLDLASRKGKAPGGYCSGYMATGAAFIFMNAVGIHQDAETLLHETGHAYHAVRAFKLPLSDYWFAPLEFAEVASMTMELFGLDYLDEFYSEEDLNRAKREQLESIITFLPWMARIDAFQHWIYTHPEQTREERSQAWLDLEERFDGRVDWTGFEDAKAAEWHRQLHIFKLPFYYIEYGIAQLGALQIWKNYLENPEKALQQYKKALSLGGSQPLPVLFETAGAKFDFSIENIQPLMDLLEEELAKLPE
jgi:oligoendopeptidase F